MQYGKFARSESNFTSDHQRMLSLINRPVPQDQVMMLAFSQKRMNETNYPYVNAVEIRGNKADDQMIITQNTVYTTYINNDMNAVNVTGPRNNL